MSGSRENKAQGSAPYFCAGLSADETQNGADGIRGRTVDQERNLYGKRIDSYNTEVLDRQKWRPYNKGGKEETA